MIPKIIKNYLSSYDNILLNIFKDKNFCEYKNKFKIYKIKVGPFEDKNFLNFILEDLKLKIKFDSQTETDNINFKYFIKEKIINKKRMNYTILKFNNDLIIDNDINIKISSKKTNFNLWINFFYTTIENYFYVINQTFDLNLLNKNKEIYNNENETKLNYELKEMEM